MIDILPPSDPEVLAAERRRREEARAERLPMTIGLIGTIVFHLLVYIGAFLFPFGDSTFEDIPTDAQTLREKYEQQELSIMLADDEPTTPMRFTETNPDAPENDPGNTNYYGARNQQAAQPDPGNDHSEKPKTTGELEESTAIVTGSKEPPVEASPQAGANGQSGVGLQAVVVGDPGKARASDPLPGFEKITGDNPDGIGMDIGSSPRGKADDDKHSEGKRDGKASNEKTVLAVNGGGVAGAPGKPAPRPRPKLQNVRPSVLANQPLSASNAGVTAVNSRLSAAGVWWDEFINTIDGQFQKLAEQLTTRPPSRSVVVIRFTVNARGEIHILDVSGEETAGRMATYICLDSIRARAPYRPWTQDMINMFGDEEPVTFSFYFW